MSTGDKPLPPRNIDGVSTSTTIKDAAYDPKGVLAHEFFPLESVMITEYGSDLCYMATYWEVDKIWRLYIQDIDVYDRLRAKLLQQRVVVVDYSDMKNLGIYLPKNKYISGIDELYKTVLDELRQLDRESLDRHLSEMTYRTFDDVLKSHYDKIS